MAVVITVHGTGDSNLSAEGDFHWWQKSGALFRHVEARLPAFDGKIEPFIWSGKNSENERRMAADAFRGKFLPQLCEAYPAEDCFHIVSHSHGGNVVSEALLDLSLDKRPSAVAMRERIASWTSVGTPFFRYQSHVRGTLSGRFGMIARYIAFWLLYGALLCLGVYLFFQLGTFIEGRLEHMYLRHVHGPSYEPVMPAEPVQDEASANAETSWVQWLFLSLVWGINALGVIAIFYGIARIIYAQFIKPVRIREEHEKRRKLNALEKRYLHFCNKFINIHSDLDEALSALSLFRQKGSTSGNAGFFDVPLLRFSLSHRSAYLGAVLLVCMAIALAIPCFLSLIEYLFVKEGRLVFGAWIVPELFAVPMILLTTYAAMFLSFYVIARFSKKRRFWIENRLESLFHERLQTASLGDDYEWEEIVDMEVYPEGFEKARWNRLPDEISKDLNDFTVEHSGTTVEKLRKAMAKSAFIGDPADLVRLLASEVTYRELIHTNYFQIPAIIDIICFGMMARDDSLTQTDWLDAEEDHKKIEDLYRKTKGSYSGHRNESGPPDTDRAASSGVVMLSRRAARQ